MNFLHCSVRIIFAQMHGLMITVSNCFLLSERKLVSSLFNFVIEKAESLKGISSCFVFLLFPARSIASLLILLQIPRTGSVNFETQRGALCWFGSL